MMLPITAYGHPVLKKKGEEISEDYPGLHQLIEDMFETMYHSKGVGLAAHQINRAIRLFVIDATAFADEYPETEGFKKVFINAEIVEEEGEEWEREEGCLSVPGINEYVSRKPVVYVSYYDENFNFHERERFEGMRARIVQHEYDHTDGIVFIERLPHFKKLLLKRRLKDISTGKADVAYRMLLPRKKGKR
ncbi:MAG: peptide deformylase [Bacteroidales bacterium]|nr:peptide deformylase [Bacteroidales bacterium]